MKVSMRKRVNSKNKKKILQAHGRNWPLQVCCSQVRQLLKVKKLLSRVFFLRYFSTAQLPLLECKQ